MIKLYRPIKELISVFFIISCLSISYGQWTTLPIVSVTSNVDVVDKNTTFIVSSNFYSEIHRLNNGVLTQIQPNTPTVNDYTGCHFFDAQNGLICGTEGSKSIVWRTQDGGANLTPVDISGEIPFYPKNFTFVNNSLGYLYAGFTFNTSKIFRTLNGGASWQLMRYENIYTYDLQFYSFAGYRATDLGLEISRDSAKTWQSIATPENIRSVCFQNAQTGYIGSNAGQIFKTTNGGATWASCMKVPAGAITKIKFPSSLVGYALVAGAGGDYLVKTLDGGNIWKRVYETTFSYQLLQNFDVFDDNTVAVVGTNTAAYSNNAASQYLKTSSAYLSGRDTSCNTALKVRLDMVGTAPWNIVVQESRGGSKTIVATKTPLDTTFVNSGGATEYNLLSVKGAGETTQSANIGGQAQKVDIPLDASFKNGVRNETLCNNTPLKYTLLLKGCGPWNIVITDNGVDTLINNIQTAEYTYSTIYKMQLNNDFQVVLKKVQAQGIWKDYGGYYYTNSVSPKDPANEATFGSSAHEFCNNTEGDIALALKGPPPYQLTLSNGFETASFTTSEVRPIVQIPIKRSGRWSITSATDGCGQMDRIGYWDVTAQATPNMPLNLAYSFTPEGDSIDFTWKDNNSDVNTALRLHERRFPLGVQKVRESIYSILTHNKDTNNINLYAVNETTGCAMTAPLLKIPSYIRTIKRGNYPQSPPNSGIALADINGDNLPDILAANGFYVNKGNFNFTYMPQNFGGTPSVVGDMDNDGDLDFLVNNTTEGTTKVYFNNGNLSFTLIQTLPCVHATLFDYDFDGLLDIAAAWKVYKNTGSNQYTLIPSVPITGRPYYYDLNKDGYVDLLMVFNDYSDVSNLNFAFYLYSPTNRNWGGGGHLAGANLVATPNGISFGDILGKTGIEDLIAFCAPIDPNSSFTGRSSAESVTILTGTAQVAELSYSRPPTGSGEGLLLDINNDGDLEIFDENALWMNPAPTNGLSNFYFGSPKEYISNGAPASADFDNDGDLDIAVALPQGGFDIFENKFETKNNWLKVKLNAQTLNRSALGTRIIVYFKDKNGEQRILTNAIGGRHGCASRSDITAHFGLGKTTLIDSVTVKWSSSKRTILRGVQVNQTLTIDETTNPVRPPYPIDLQVIAATNNQLQLTWKDLANNELGYIIQRSKATADSGYITLDTLRPNTTSYLTPNTAGNNFYRVFAYNASANSAFSNTATLNTPSVCGLTVSVDTFFVSPEKSITSCDSLLKISVPQVANLQYQWFYNETPVANAISNNFTANKTGVYSLKVKNSLGCTRLLAPVKVALGFTMSPKITLVNGTSITCNSPVSLSNPNPSIPNVVYKWVNLKDSILSTAKVLTLSKASESGFYKLLGRDTLTGCVRKSDSVDVRIFAPKATYKALDTLTCFGDNGLIWAAPASATETYNLERKISTNWEILAKDKTKADTLKVTAGTYRIVAKTTQLANCMDISPEISVKDTGFTITGKILLPNNTPSVSSLVKLFKIELNNTSAQVDATNTDANGNYQFSSKTKGNYKILAYPLNQTTVAPTYFGNTVNTNVATLLNAIECRTYIAPIKLSFATSIQDMSDKVFVVEVQNNPIYDQLSLNIRTTKEETLSIQLLSLSGSVLQTWSQQVNASTSTMSLNLFVVKGAYILKIENQEHVKQFFKIVKL